MSAASPPPAPLRLRSRRGLDLRLPGAAAPEAAHAGPTVRTVAVLGDDAPGVRPELRVEVGERVRAGDTLFVDRRRPALRFTAPGAGEVVAIERGARRRLEAVVVRLEGTDQVRLDAQGRGAAPPPAETVRRLLLESGIWTAFRTRPFSRIPDPDASPRALFVTAMDSEPLAPPVEALIRERGDAFRRGVAALAQLAQGPVFVCARPGAALPVPEHPAVRLAEFAGPHPAGLPGTHVHRLAPAETDRVAWHVSWADAVDVGELLATGRIPHERVIALGGPCVVRPRLLRTRLGACVEDLVRGELREDACRVLSGSVLSGRHATGSGGFLGRLHHQVCAIPEEPDPPRRGWIAPGRGGRAWTVPGSGRRASFGTALGSRGPFFPLERMERAWALDAPMAPLLRALVIGDADAARELGVLDLAEEDLALAAFLCPGKLEYGRLLRAVLDEIEGQEP